MKMPRIVPPTAVAPLHWSISSDSNDDESELTPDGFSDSDRSSCYEDDGFVAFSESGYSDDDSSSVDSDDGLIPFNASINSDDDNSDTEINFLAYHKIRLIAIPPGFCVLTQRFSHGRLFYVVENAKELPFYATREALVDDALMTLEPSWMLSSRDGWEGPRYLYDEAWFQKWLHLDPTASTFLDWFVCPISLSHTPSAELRGQLSFKFNSPLLHDVWSLIFNMAYAIPPEVGAPPDRDNFPKHPKNFFHMSSEEERAWEEQKMRRKVRIEFWVMIRRYSNSTVNIAFLGSILKMIGVKGTVKEYLNAVTV